MSKGYVDADGHIMEKAEELIQYLEEPWRSADPVIPRRLLPTGDDFHTPRIRRKGIFNEAVGPEHWLDYLAKTGLEFTVLYPTAGLAHGFVVNPEWAGVYARAWNNYVFDKYLKKSAQFKAVSLIPIQDPSVGGCRGTQTSGERPGHGGRLYSIQRAENAFERKTVLADLRGSRKIKLSHWHSRRLVPRFGVR